MARTLATVVCTPTWARYDVVRYVYEFTEPSDFGLLHKTAVNTTTIQCI